MNDKMTKAYLDCEFNGFEGELISMAIVVDEATYFYEVLNCSNPVPWVKENVMPVLHKEPVSILTFKVVLAEFLNRYKELEIVADWPDDIKYLCKAMITGPGTMIKTPALSFHLNRIDAPSLIPHNALADAVGIMRYLKNQK